MDQRSSSELETKTQHLGTRGANQYIYRNAQSNERKIIALAEATVDTVSHSMDQNRIKQSWTWACEGHSKQNLRMVSN